jgi:hypothetical protein
MAALPVSLIGGRRGAVGLEQPADEHLVALGLGDVRVDHPLEPRVVRRAGGVAEVVQGLLLEPVGVGEVLDELFLDGGHGPSATPARYRLHARMDAPFST